MSVKLRWKKLKNGKKSAYLDIYHNKKRNYEFLRIYISGSDSKEIKKEKRFLANDIRNKREIALQASDYDYTPLFKKNIDFIAYFKDYEKNYSKKDFRKVKGAFNKFQDFIGKEKIPIINITPRLCEDFQSFLKNPENGLSGETPYMYWKIFKAVIKRAIREEIISKNPAEEIKFTGSQKYNNQLRKKVLTEDELRLLAKTECGNNQVKRAFILACFTGLGMAEIRDLTWSRIDNDRIRLFRKKNGQPIDNNLPPTAIKVLGEPGKPNEKIFEIPSETAVNKNLKNWVARAGIEKKITFYCARHTFATMLLLRGANLKTVADSLGQTSTKHTIKYLYYVDSLKTEAINKLPNIEL
jgi:integrase